MARWWDESSTVHFLKPPIISASDKLKLYSKRIGRRWSPNLIFITVWATTLITASSPPPHQSAHTRCCPRSRLTTSRLPQTSRLRTADRPNTSNATGSVASTPHEVWRSRSVRSGRSRISLVKGWKAKQSIVRSRGYWRRCRHKRRIRGSFRRGSWRSFWRGRPGLLGKGISPSRTVARSRGRSS